MRRRLLLLAIIFASIASTKVSAQFYYEGVESGFTRWNEIDTPQYRLIFPVNFAEGGYRYASILNTIYPRINYGFKDPVRKIPIILRTRNQLSNGFVSWAPKHKELVTRAPWQTYALSWDKQVAVHEARHVAQISIMSTGFTKLMTRILGEAGVSVGLLVVNKWQLEGDATLAETQFAEYGRGLQPDFTLGYRAMASRGELTMQENIDPFIYGSYKKVIPSVYHYGYQVLSAAETYLSPTIWYDVVRFSARHPYYIYPSAVYLRRNHNTTFKGVAVRAFKELDSLWRPTYEVENSFTTITAEPSDFTNYENPLPYRNSIVATKWDMDTLDMQTNSGEKVMTRLLNSFSDNN